MQETPLYVIGDIHGQKTMLDEALGLIKVDGGPDARIIFLGDYTDRGPDSKGVVETLIAGRDAEKAWTFILGNHDKMFVNFVAKGTEHDPRVKSQISWINKRLGGVTTLASYGIEGTPVLSQDADTGLEFLHSYVFGDEVLAPKDIQQQAVANVPTAHLDFLSELPRVHETEHHIFVHAGLRPSVALNQQDPEDLIWIRDGFLESDYDFGKLVVHGHTALDHPQHHGNRVNLDGGAGYGRPLLPAVFEGKNCWLLTPEGRQALKP